MNLTNSKLHYGAIPQLMHWLTALCVILAWLVGQFGDDLPKAMHPTALLLHMTLGQCVVALLITRLIWRLVDPPPPLEATRFGRLAEFGARLSHWLMYGLLLAVPLLGIMVQLKRGHALPIFGFWPWPSPWPADRALARTLLRVHYYLANTLLILAGVHAAAALVHHWLLHDRTLVRMLPGAVRAT